MHVRRFAVLLGLVAMAAGCGGEPVEITPGLQAFVGARIIDGNGDAPVENGVLVVRDGRIEAVVAALEGLEDPVGALREALTRIEAVG